MKFFKAVLPNLSIALAVATLVVLILHSYNPVMGFLTGLPFLVLAASSCLAALGTAIVLYADWRRR